MFVICLSNLGFILLYFILLAISYYFYKKKYRYCKFVFIAALILYILSIIQITMFPIYIMDKDQIKAIREELGSSFKYYQIIPFKTIRNTLINSAWKKQILGNIIMFIPLPIFIGFMNKKNICFIRILLLGISFSVGIESIQLIINIIVKFPSRVADIDDIILNSMGVLIGLILFAIIRKMNKLNSILKKLLINN